MPLNQDDKQHLSEALDRGEPKPWLWNEDGLRVLGTVRRLEEIETKDFGKSLSLILEVDGCERRILLTTVLKQKLMRLNIQVGQALGIERSAEKTSPVSGGTPYWDYGVAILQDEVAEGLNWGTQKGLPETVDAEVVDDHYEVPHLPRDAGGV